MTVKKKSMTKQSPSPTKEKYTVHDLSEIVPEEVISLALGDQKIRIELNKALESFLNTKYNEGYQLHSVFGNGFILERI